MPFDRRLPAYAGVSAALMLPFAAFFNWDDGQALYLLVFVINGIALSIVAARKRGRRWISLVTSLVVYLGVSWPLLTNFYGVHTVLKWQMTKDADRAALLAQASPAHHEFKHLDWDGWGFAGMDTEVYLVYDPGDSLSAASTRDAPGKPAGIPCAVWRVRRLESHYYAVTFFTDAGWDACGSP